MREVVLVVGTEEKLSKLNKKYKITHVIVDSGDECEYYGDDIKRGDLVEVFFDHGKIKAQKRNPRLDNIT